MDYILRPDSKRLYVSNSGDRSVSVIDTGTPPDRCNNSGGEKFPRESTPWWFTKTRVSKFQNPEASSFFREFTHHTPYNFGLRFESDSWNFRQLLRSYSVPEIHLRIPPKGLEKSRDKISLPPSPRAAGDVQRHLGGRREGCTAWGDQTVNPAASPKFADIQPNHN